MSCAYSALWRWMTSYPTCRSLRSLCVGLCCFGLSARYGATTIKKTPKACHITGRGVNPGGYGGCHTERRRCGTHSGSVPQLRRFRGFTPTAGLFHPFGGYPVRTKKYPQHILLRRGWFWVLSDFTPQVATLQIQDNHRHLLLLSKIYRCFLSCWF